MYNIQSKYWLQTYHSVKSSLSCVYSLQWNNTMHYRLSVQLLENANIISVWQTNALVCLRVSSSVLNTFVQRRTHGNSIALLACHHDTYLWDTTCTLQELGSCWDGRPCQSKVGQKVGGWCDTFRGGGAGSPSNTTSPGLRPIRYDTIYLRAPKSWRIASLVCHTQPNKKE